MSKKITARGWDGQMRFEWIWFEIGVLLLACLVLTALVVPML